jgi:hypothetical protein
MRLQHQLALGVSIALIVYAALRAWFVPLVFDEAFTFSQYVVTGGFQPFHSFLDANNHLINSALTHVSFLLLGDHPFALRVPNLLALVMSLWFLVRTREMFSDQWLWLAFFIGVSTIHYLFDFFSLSRGYGLSLAFLTAATYYSWRFGQTLRLVHFGLTLTMASLSLWSNLALMVPVLALGGITGLMLLAKGEPSLRYRSAGSLLGLVLFGLPVAYAVLWSLELKSHGRLYLGEGVTAWDAIGAGLAHTMLRLSWSEYVVAGALALYLIIVSLAVIHRSWAWKATLSTSVFLLTVTGVFILHHLMDVNFPIRRAAMHIPFLMLMSLFTLLDGLPRYVRMLSGGFVSLFIAIHFVSHINLNHTLDWRYECVPKTFVERIAHYPDSTGRKPIVSCNSFMNYLIGLQRDDVTSSFYSDRLQSFPSIRADLLIATENMKWSGLDHFDTLEFNHQTGMTLMQRQIRTRWKAVHEDHLALSSTSTAPCAFRIDSIHHLVGIPLAVEVEMVATALAYPINWSVYGQVWSSETDCMYSGDINLGATHYDLRRPLNVHLKSELITLPEGAHHIRVFMVGNNNRPFTLSQVKLTLLAEDTE